MKRNRMIIIMLCTFIMYITFAMPIFATENITQLPSDMDVDLLKQEIADEINEYSGSSLSPPREIVKEDIDFSKAFKFYVDTNIFAVGSANFDEVTQLLEDGNYMFEVPVYVDNRVLFEADISRGLPVSDKTKESGLLTEKQIENLERNVGKWHVSGIGSYDEQVEFRDYYKIAMEMAGITDKQPLLVGGLPYFHEPVALFPDGNGNISKIVPIYHNAIPWADLGLKPQDGDVVFDYTEIKEIVNEKSKSWLDSILPESEDKGNGNPNQGDSVQAEVENSDGVAENSGIENETPSVSSDSINVWIIVAATIVAILAAATAILLIRRKKAQGMAVDAGDTEDDGK